MEKGASWLAWAVQGGREMIDVGAMIERWQTGDERAAEALYNHFRDRTFHLAYGLLGDVAEAEEVAQDALAHALLNIKRYDPQRASFATWLHMITVSRSRDRYRRRRFPSLSLTAWLGRGGDLPDGTPGPEGHAIQSETRSQVWKAVQDLEPPFREAVLLRYWAGHTYQEIADILGCPLRTAQSRVRLAFQRLRDVLSQSQLNDFGLEKEKVL
jgi:RNA polymerase sigma-70 factor (ECF subfamily)